MPLLRSAAPRAAMILAVALAAAVLVHAQTAVAPARAGSADAVAPARPRSADAAVPVLVVGDSLAVGLRPSLPRLLGEPVTWEARSGRTTPQGLVALRAGLRIVHPAVVVVSLGTNDGPDPARFRSRIDRALAAMPSGACVVWSRIYRPARKGPYAALNRVLDREAAHVARLHLIAWDAAVARQAVALPDGLHPDAAGFAYRSRMFARAVRRDCGVGPARA